eukprot:924684-Pleurochrysis_carterae.AAC.1
MQRGALTRFEPLLQLRLWRRLAAHVGDPSSRLLGGVGRHGRVAVVHVVHDALVARRAPLVPRLRRLPRDRLILAAAKAVAASVAVAARIRA